MPVKETPWGMMRQARAATHTPGSQSGGGSPVEFRPPKPGFLPPAPPPFSASPLPPVLSSVGITGGTVTYDTVCKPEPDPKPEHAHEQQHQQLTPATTQTNGASGHSPELTATTTTTGTTTGTTTTGTPLNTAEATVDDGSHPNGSNGVDEVVPEMMDKSGAENGDSHHAESSEYEYYDDTDDYDDEPEPEVSYEKAVDQRLLAVEEEEVTEVVKIYSRPKDPELSRPGVDVIKLFTSVI